MKINQNMMVYIIFLIFYVFINNVNNINTININNTIKKKLFINLGEWVENKRHGKGIQYFLGGEKYDGE